MEVIKTAISDVVVIKPKVFADDRGFFMETYRASAFSDLGIGPAFVQDNHSASSKGVLRGLHYQVKQPQGKLVRVISGEVYDVAVDLRKSSSTFGQYVGQVLSAENKKMMWVPPGFAHGFLVISDYAEFVYKCTDYYAPQYERSLLWSDSSVAIDWPSLNGVEYALSEKDRAGLSLSECDTFA